MILSVSHVWIKRYVSAAVWSGRLAKGGEEEHRLIGPNGIATNTHSLVVVADMSGRNAKVFSSSGEFLYFLRLPTDDGDKELFPWKVATDGEDNVYVLTILKRDGKEEWQGVYVYDQYTNLHHKLPLREGSRIPDCGSVTVSDHHQVFVVVVRADDGSEKRMEMYDTDRRFVHSFGRGILKGACDITITNNNRVMVLDHGTRSVQVFNAQGERLHPLKVQGDVSGGAIAFHQASEHVVVSSRNRDKEDRQQVSIYTKDGEFVRSVQLDGHPHPWLRGVTVTVDGRIAVPSFTDQKAYVL